MENIFVDAQEMHIKNPRTFEVPDKQELNNILVGDFVKVCPIVEDGPSDRFWTKITDINNNIIKGVVDNHLIWTDKHGLKLGDVVEFERKNIYSILED